MIVATSLVAFPVLAGTQTWNIQSGDIIGTGYGNYISKTVDGVNMNLTGWADTAGTSGLETGKLMYWNGYGLGMVNRDESNTAPDHSIDSFNNGDYDMVLLKFDTEVNLSGFNIGWAQEVSSSNTYADVSVLAYTGNSTFNTFTSAQTWSSLVASNGGWTAQGNYANVDDYSYQAVNSVVSSKYWLIGAYNSVFGSGAGLGAGNDGFKLAAVTTTTADAPSNSVPEPGSLAVVAAGLLALSRARKSKQA